MKNNTILKESDVVNFMHKLIGEMLDEDYQRVKMFGETLYEPEPVGDYYLLNCAYHLTDKLKKEFDK